ncbi:MAG: hypothetical protein ACFCUN_11700 [Hyphomicrobiaceae bacterium]
MKLSILLAALLPLLCVSAASAAVTTVPKHALAGQSTAGALEHVQQRRAAPRRGTINRRGDRRRVDRRRFDRRRYVPGRRYGRAPANWRRYSSRPRDWRRRGCIIVGPIWFCP